MPAWSPFGGRLTAAPAQFDSRWRDLTRVQHVTHVTLARRIVEDGRIAPRLVGEGMLMDTRRLVTWVSPNTWGPGARYGSVEFAFDWLPLLATRSLMWVEPIRYNLQTVRLLLTDRPADWLPLGLLPYDPSVDDGPVQLVGDGWFRRGDIVVEIMIDGDILLSSCIELGFVTHHPDYCSLGLRNCAEAGTTPRTKARVVGAILGAGLHGGDHALARGDDPLGGLNQGFSELWFALQGGKCVGPVATLDMARVIARSAALLAGEGEFDTARRAFHLIAGEDLALDALRGVIRDHFGRPEMRLD